MPRTFSPTLLFVLIAIGSAAAIPGPSAAQTGAQTSAQPSGCVDGEKIDGSTADQARKKIEAAGYREVRALSKGCDNFWHGKATRDGLAVNVALSPDGRVMVEGD